MSLTISIDDSQIRKINFELKKFSGKALEKSQQQAINKTATGLQTFINKKIREKRQLSVKEIKTKFINVEKARKGLLLATVTISARELTMIRFIKGPKRPRKQKGIEVRKRKPLRAAVDKGKTRILKGAFIAFPHKGKPQVFRRMSDTKRVGRRKVQKLRILRTPSLAVLVDRPQLSRAILNETGRRLSKEFLSAFRNQLSKIKTL